MYPAYPGLNILQRHVFPVEQQDNMERRQSDRLLPEPWQSSARRRSAVWVAWTDPSTLLAPPHEECQDAHRRAKEGRYTDADWTSEKQDLQRGDDHRATRRPSPQVHIGHSLEQ